MRGGGQKNLIVEGDNFDALRWLRMTMSGRVKCIYVDPPYNTGARDWVYNDHYVGKEDRWRHSTWLEFLYRRFALARDLLTEDGVILVSINDDNRARLELMLDEVLPGMRVGSLVWRTKDAANDADRNFSSVHEHILIYSGPSFEFPGHELGKGKYKNPDRDPRGVYSSDPITQPKTRIERENGYFPIQDKRTGWWYPCNPDSVWRYTRDAESKSREPSIDELAEDDRLIFTAKKSVRYETKAELVDALMRGTGPRDGNGRPLLRLDLPDLDFWVQKPIGLGRPYRKSFWDEKESTRKPVGSWMLSGKDAFELDYVELSSDKQGVATREISEIFNGKAFNFPKPSKLLTQLLGATTSPGDIVLDFFAGSATTAQAVMQLNAEDGGDRRFVMVSSTEATAEAPDKNLCHQVTAERVRRLNASDDPAYAALNAPFAYLKMVPMAFEDIDYDLTPAQVWTALETLHGLPITPHPGGAWAMHEGEDATLVLVERLDDALIEVLRGLAGRRVNAFVYAWAPGQVTAALDGLDLEVRPVRETLVKRFLP